MESSRPSDIEMLSQSFIVKIWAEETTSTGHWLMWRGHITHVPSGTRRYFDSLSGLYYVISHFMSQLGIPFSRPAGLKALLCRWLDRSERGRHV